MSIEDLHRIVPEMTITHRSPRAPTHGLNRLRGLAGMAAAMIIWQAAICIRCLMAGLDDPGTRPWMEPWSMDLAGLTVTLVFLGVLVWQQVRGKGYPARALLSLTRALILVCTGATLWTTVRLPCQALLRDLVGHPFAVGTETNATLMLVTWVLAVWTSSSCMLAGLVILVRKNSWF
jgi:hypothetical protein